MIEQSKLMEMLLSIKEVARVQHNVITKEEIKKYFEGEDIDENQFLAIYQYLGENGIGIPGFIHVEYGHPEDDDDTENISSDEAASKTSTAEDDDEFNNEESERPDPLALYMEELGEIKVVAKSEMTSLFMAAKEGDSQAKNKLTESYLPVVVEIADQYKDKGAWVEDLIQEGNIGLLQGIATLDTLEKIEDADEFLKENIKMSILEFIDDSGEDEIEATMVSKASLINEAVKVLTKDLGHAPSLEELSAYTQVPIEELKDLK